MKLLFFKPGFLTKQYWEGKRVDYIHPLRLYFFVIVIGVLLGGFFFEHYKDEIKERIMASTVNVTTTPNEQDSTLSPSTSPHADSNINRKSLDEQEGKARISKGIDRFIGQLKYIMFGLLPLYALIFKILYFRRKSFFVDHLIYAMHLQSFAFLSRLSLGVVAFLLPVLDSPLKWISYGLIMIYTAISLRYLYHQSWWKTILKSLIATGLIILTVGVVFVIYMVIAILG